MFSPQTRHSGFCALVLSEGVAERWSVSEIVTTRVAGCAFTVAFGFPLFLNGLGLEGGGGERVGTKDADYVGTEGQKKRLLSPGVGE